ncbi:hypothetical protein DIPPA_15868 [Diplonema papillatum]|nr:hypothetical protein DIPPA_15868 [Diplonema papillatum]KAJ9443395.1 hypothetical protein DIPPA_15868 [Diplonema papillatum]
MSKGLDSTLSGTHTKSKTLSKTARSLLAQSLNKSNFINGIPRKLWVTVLDTAAGGEHHQNPCRSASGLYILQEGTKINGECVWEQAGGNCKIQANDMGHWAVVENGVDKLLCINATSSAMPHETGAYRSKHFTKARNREKDAALSCGNGVWTGEDFSGDACVTCTEAKVHGFRYGRAVVASSDIKEDGKDCVPLGCLGIVMGPSPDPGAVKVKFDSFDSPFNVNHNELDLAEGPEVMVQNTSGRSVSASVVNVTETRVKVHYFGKPKSEDEWYDKDSSRILPIFPENPDGYMYYTKRLPNPARKKRPFRLIQRPRVEQTCEMALDE